MSQNPQPNPQPNKKGGTFRSLLWSLGYGTFGGLLGYFAFLGLSAILSYASGGEFIVAKILHDFNYINASSAIQGIALSTLYQSQTLPYIGAIAGAVVGGVTGYFKGKQEDKESQ